MIKKEELLKVLNEAVMTEERIVPIYDKHLRSAIFWTGIDEDKSQTVRNYLQTMIDDSKKHFEITKSLLERIKKEKRNAF